MLRIAEGVNLRSSLVFSEHFPGNAQSLSNFPHICSCFLGFFFLFFFFSYLFLFLAVLCLHCCAWAFSSCGEQGLLFIVVSGLLIAVASLVVERGL